MHLTIFQYQPYIEKEAIKFTKLFPNEREENNYIKDAQNLSSPI